MAVTITSSTGVVMSPVLSIEPASAATAGNVLHPIIGRPLPAVTLRPAGPRTGTLELLFSDWSAAVAAYAAHRAAATYALVDSVQPDQNMTYVAAGEIALAVVADTLKEWTLSIDYSEVGT